MKFASSLLHDDKLWMNLQMGTPTVANWEVLGFVLKKADLVSLRIP